MKWILVHRIHFKFVNWNKIKRKIEKWIVNRQKLAAKKPSEMLTLCSCGWEKSSAPSAGGKSQDVLQMCVLWNGGFFISRLAGNWWTVLVLRARDWYVECSDMSFSTFANVRPKRLIDSTFLMFDGFGGVIAENYWFVKIHFPLSNQQTIRFATRNNRKNIFKRFIFLCHSFQQQRKNHFHHTWFGYSHGCVIRRFHKCHSGKRANQRQEKRKKAIYFTFPPEILAAIEKCFISEFFFPSAGNQMPLHHFAF